MFFYVYRIIKLPFVYVIVRVNMKMDSPAVSQRLKELMFSLIRLKPQEYLRLLLIIYFGQMTKLLQFYQLWYRMKYKLKIVNYKKKKRKKQ